MGDVLTKKNSRKARTKINVHIANYSSSANTNFKTLSADSAAIEIQNYKKTIINKKQTRIKQFIYNNFKSNKLKIKPFIIQETQQAYASSLMKKQLCNPSSEGNNSSEDSINWDDLINFMDNQDDFVYDIIPPDIVQEITTEEVPDWYINFVNSEQSIATFVDRMCI